MVNINSLFEKIYVKEPVIIKNEYNNQLCKKCNVQTFIDSITCYYICPSCGLANNQQIGSIQHMQSPYKEPCQFINDNTYSRVAQFEKQLFGFGCINFLLREDLKNMFISFHPHYEEICKGERKYIIRYEYIIIKLLEILNMKRYIKYFKLPKSRSTIYKYDKIWKKISDKVGWKFYKTKR